MLMLSNAASATMTLMTKFEMTGGGNQKWFLELPRAEARQLKIQDVIP